MLTFIYFGVRQQNLLTGILMSRAHRFTIWLAPVLLGAVAATCQGLPDGVTYKPASPEVNAKAKLELERALATTAPPAAFLSGEVTCGPILWDDLKDQRAELSKESRPVNLFLSLPEAVQVEARGFRTPEQRDLFWKTVLEKYPELRKGVVRPARRAEILHFWSTIPFDIEEPFFAIDTPSGVFIANLKMDNGMPVLFWLDRVDNLHKLEKRAGKPAS